MKGLQEHTKVQSLWPNVPSISIFASKVLQIVSGNPLLRATVITLWYMSVVSCAYYGAYLLRFDGEIPGETFDVFCRTLPVLLLVRIITFQRFELYSGLLHYVSVDDVWRTMKAIAVSTLIFMVIAYLMQPGFVGFPRSVFIVETMLTLGILSGYRMTLRAVRERFLNGP
jgi:FlaA1/EpsC-like NDP-sugar epimerase